MAEPGLRERKKQQTREHLVDVAIELMESHGFDAVTVDQIAEAAAVSPRTFFRYFGSKEAVLFADQDEMLGVLRASVEAQPAGAPPVTVLREAVTALARHGAEHPDRQLRRARLANTGAAVDAYRRTVLQPQWEDAITDALARHLDVDAEADVRPRLLAYVGIAVMLSVGHTWTASGGAREVEEVLEQAFTSLEAAVLDSITTRPSERP